MGLAAKIASDKLKQTRMHLYKIEIFFNDTGSPALIKDPGDFDSIYVVMPMKG